MGRTANRSRGGLVLIGVLLAVLATATAARADTDPWDSACHDCSGTYTGTYAGKYTFLDQNGGNDVLSVHYAWSESITQQADGQAASGPVKVQGGYNLIPSSPEALYQPCSGTISETHSDSGSEVFSFQEAGPDHYDLSGLFPGANTKGCGPSVYRNGEFTGPSCHWTEAKFPNSLNSDGETGLNVEVAAGSYEQSDSCQADFNPNADTSDYENVTDKLSWRGLSASGTGTHNPPARLPYGPWFSRAKKVAKADLARTVDQWGPLCTEFAISGTLAGAGVLLAGAPGGAGVTLALTGALTNQALAPFCVSAVTRVVLDLKTYDDPPLRTYTVLARPKPGRTPHLAACGRTDRAYCTQLRSAFARYDAAVADGDADVSAIEQTVSREHAAADARRRTDLDRQDADLEALVADLDRANAHEASAARAVAKILTAAHIRFQLSATQDQALGAYVAGLLAKQHVSTTDVVKVDRSAFTPRAINLLRALS